MSPGDLEVFTARLVELGELFDANLTEGKQLLYFQALEDVDVDLVLGGLRDAAKACKFFPKPAEIRALVLGDDDDAAEKAWMSLRAAMSWAGGYASLVTADAALGEAVMTVFASWPELCALDLSPEMWSSKRKEFGRVYRVCRSRGLSGARYLVGICERQNAGRLDWARYNPVYWLDGSEIRALSGAEADAARAQLAATAGFQRLTANTALMRKSAERPGEGA